MRKKFKPFSPFDKERFTCLLNTVDISIKQLEKITQGQYSHNSLLAIRKDWFHFCDFALTQGHTALPASPQTIHQFIEQVSHTRKYASLKRYVVTISSLHQILGYSDPTSTHEVTLSLQQHRLEKHGDERQTIAMTKQHLEQLAEQLAKNDDALAIRDLAIYSIMFECALKRSELRELVTDQVHVYDDINNAQVRIMLQGNEYCLSQQSSKYMCRWLALINDDYPPIFRSINKHKQISINKLNDSSIFRVFQKASFLLGLPDHLQFSGQSARVGAIHELNQQGYKLREIQDFGRWNTPVMPNHYLGNCNQAELGKLIFKSFKRLD